MSKTVSFVLHGHMPWVLHHGHWPHGDFWIFEAAAGVYIPILQMLANLDRDGPREGRRRLEARIEEDLGEITKEISLDPKSEPDST